MSYTFRLPDIGEGLEEAEIIAWLVHPGDVVERDQPLVEVLTDKANSELPSPVSGKILRLGAAEGERLSVGEVLVELDDGSDSDTSDNTPRTEPDDLNHSAVTAVKKRIKAAPATRKLALDLGVEIENVTGTGPGGRT